MTNRRRIGLVGCGRWGRHILRDLVTLRCDVTVVDPSDVARRQALAGGAVEVVEGLAALRPVDGLVVATPTTAHAALVEALVERRVPIFVEKPLTADRASAWRLARLAPDHLFVLDKWRYHPAVEMLGGIARSGELGPVLGLRTTRLGWGSSQSDVDSIWTLAPHDLSIALEVLGRLLPPRCAVAERAGETATGLVAILGTEPWHVLEVSHRHPEYRRGIQLHCREGLAIWTDGDATHIRIVRGSAHADAGAAREERRPLSPELPLLRELATCLAHLDGGPPPRSRAADGAVVVDALAALRELAGLAADGGPA